MVLNSVTFPLNLSSTGFFFCQHSGSSRSTVFLVLSLMDIFYLAFWIFWDGSCAILIHLVSLSSSFSSNRIFTDFHYSGRKKGIKVSLALLSVLPLPGLSGSGCSAGSCKAVPPLHCFAYMILNLSSGWLPLSEQIQCFVRLPVRGLEKCSVGPFLFYQQSPHICLSYCVTV